MTKSPDPFDPVEKEEISRMVSEGGREPNLPDTIREAVETDGNHSSAKWAHPTKYWKTLASTPLTKVKK